MTIETQFVLVMTILCTKLTYSKIDTVLTTGHCRIILHAPARHRARSTRVIYDPCSPMTRCRMTPMYSISLTSDLCKKIGVANNHVASYRSFYTWSFPKYQR